ncbi:MAG: TonB-dependent receptor, partial [Muribaculaceae bacterium]|nr:TonB-dependent receptor [Muribaculaceae bacterium]
MWALVCTTAPIVCSHNTFHPPSTNYDSIEYIISPQLLDEVVVKTSPIINKSDRKIIRPDIETLRTSSDGIDLLRRLHLSRITVNPMTNAITVSGGGEVILCINGVESTAAQIAAVSPQDIARVEYHDNPGLRYAGATAVIDYITISHTDGGNMSFDSFSAVEKGRWATIDHIAGQYNRNNSAWSVNAGYMGQRKDQWIRDYDETWHYPDGAMTRHEDGMPVTVGQSGLESTLNYNHQHPSGNMFNARIGLNLNNVPNQEEGDRRAILLTSDAETPILVTEHTEEHSFSPNIGLYYQHRLSDSRHIIFDAQGSYMHSRMSHEYSEDNDTENNRVNGDKYALKFICMYEYLAGSRRWSIGVSENSSIIGNTYYRNTPERIRINRSESALLAEYSNRSGNWFMTGNIRVAYHHLGQSGRNIDKVFALPSASISYKPSAIWFMRYSASLDYTMPSAAEISDIIQPIQAGMVRSGNTGLQPFRVIVQSFDASFESEYVSVNPRIEYRNEHNPIMESVVFENGLFVRTYFNQRSFQRLTIGGAVSFRPWKSHLSVTAEPILTRYFSHGIDYHHCHNIFRLGLSADFSYRNWLAYAS